MKSKMHRFLGGISLVTGLVLTKGLALNISASAQQLSTETASRSGYCKYQLGGESFTRTELLFGLSKPDGRVTEEEFQSFVKTYVTPRFPSGLTLLTGKGQFRNSNGKIIQEEAKLLILFYSFSNASSKSINQIREDYKTLFQQESVLRVDAESCISY